jgi:hypothetical protein
VHVRVRLKFILEYRTTRVCYVLYEYKKAASETYKFMQIIFGIAAVSRAKDLESLPSFRRERDLVQNNSRLIKGKLLKGYEIIVTHIRLL